MLSDIDRITQQLKEGRISLQDLLSIRHEVRAPFRLHPLGFYACTLIAEGTRKIRLHFWPTDEGAPQSQDFQIHDHLFAFRSWVLSGAVENVEYTTSPGGQKFSVYRTEYIEHASTLTKTSAARTLSVQRRYTYSAGSSYEVAAGTLHETIRIGTQPAITVLSTSDVSNSSPIVLGPTDGSDRYTFQRAEIDETLVEAMLSRTLTPSLR